uniref:BCCT family transporter n=1 Tax=Bacillus sp. JCM 19041 TaxID=1460637 RepID=UPI0006D25C74
MLASNFGWFYLLATSFFVLLAVYLVVGPYGKIKLGRPDEEPEYSYFTWFAFLFTAGMGVGLVFFAISEPLSHMYDPPSAEPGSMAAIEESLRYTIFHWGFHPWATYSVVALALAYFKFRHNAPALISSAFTPILGDRTRGPIGIGIDVLAVFATVFGIATSLGLGASQITAGLSYNFASISNTTMTQLIVIGVITLIFIGSAISGVDRGIRFLSWGNIVIAIVLMAFVFLLGSSVEMIETFMSMMGSYLQNLPEMTLDMHTFTDNREFLDGWTLFYWAWWIGWSPFVGAFIARVSRGRTIREFVLGVTIIPVLFSAIWFAIFGVAGMEMDQMQDGTLFQLIQSTGEEFALFAFIESLPMSTIVMIVAILLISSFFITSADAATFVLAMLTTGGRLNPVASVKVIWGIVLAGTASVLLLSGGLRALEMAMLIAAFPFGILMIIMAFSLLKALRSESNILRMERKQKEADPEFQKKSSLRLKELRKRFGKSVAKNQEPERTDDP